MNQSINEKLIRSFEDIDREITVRLHNFEFNAISFMNLATASKPQPSISDPSTNYLYC